MIEHAIAGCIKRGAQIARESKIRGQFDECRVKVENRFTGY